MPWARRTIEEEDHAAGAVAVRFSGLDEAVTEGAPKLRKSLGPEHAMSDEVIVAYAMNGAPLPLLNGFPIRLVVPGWYATYWVKMLSDIADSIAKHPGQSPGARIGAGGPTLIFTSRCGMATFSQE